MIPFKQRFDVMLQTLRNHPAIEVFSVVVQPPAEPYELTTAEEILGQPLPAAMREFYAAHNGIFLEWGLKGVDYAEKTAPFRYPDYDQPPGCINLLPIADVATENWETSYHVNEISQSQQKLLFGAVPSPQPPIRAVCVDNFSKFNHADLIIGPEPLVVVATDHGADMSSSDFLPFELYLEVTLAVFGTNRYAPLGCDGSGKSKRISKWDQYPTLDEILKNIEDRHRG